MTTERFRPHAIRPARESVRVVIACRDFAAMQGISHVGLAVSAMNNAKFLRSVGYWADVWTVASAQDLEQRIDNEQAASHRDGKVPISHVVISAPWIATPELTQMVHRHTEIEWCVCSHSNIGFLQSEPRAITLLREDGDLAISAINFRVASNSKRLTTWWKQAYHQDMIELPNLRDTEGSFRHHSNWTPGTLLKIGCFGAIRGLKNQLSAAGAAIEIANRLRCECEFWMNSGRSEPQQADRSLNAIRALLANLHNMSFHQAPWAAWPAFRNRIRSMHLLIQVSYTESFNMVTADGVLEGVPSVTSDAIDWVPSNWQVEVDDVNAIASTGVALLHDPAAAANGLNHLNDHNRYGLALWEDFLMKAPQVAHV